MLMLVGNEEDVSERVRETRVSLVSSSSNAALPSCSEVGPSQRSTSDQSDTGSIAPSVVDQGRKW